MRSNSDFARKSSKGTHRVYLVAPTLVLIGNVTERNAHIASAGGVYAGSYYLKCTAAVSHTGPPGGQKQNSEARYCSLPATPLVRVSTRVAC